MFYAFYSPSIVFRLQIYQCLVSDQDFVGKLSVRNFYTVDTMAWGSCPLKIPMNTVLNVVDS